MNDDVANSQRLRYPFNAKTRQPKTIDLITSKYPYQKVFSASLTAYLRVASGSEWLLWFSLNSLLRLKLIRKWKWGSVEKWREG